MKRRSVLQAALAAGLPASVAWADGVGVGVEPEAFRLASAWRVGTDADGAAGRDRVGLIAVDWGAAQLTIAAEVAVPSRAHGLLAMPDGGFVVVGNRPGRWLLRCDAAGAPARWLHQREGGRTFNGHVQCSADAKTLFTTETDPATGRGWIGVRDAASLAQIGQFETAGLDPHQVLRATDGALLVANGGIVRDRLGRKVEGERLWPSLVRLDAANGRLLGQWTLADPDLSIRHLAWSTAGAEPLLGSGKAEPLLGVGLQAEHAQAAERLAAPVLAVWNGQTLHLPRTDARGGGYAGDIAAGPAGGFVLSAQKQGRGLWWHPGAPEELTLVAQLTEPCALVPWPGAAGVQIGAARGLALWHAHRAPAMLPWPVALAIDNHAVRLSLPG